MTFSETRKLIKKLKVVRSKRFSFLSLIKTLNTEHNIPYKSKWCDSFFGKYEPSLPNLSKQSAFDQCVSTKIMATNESILIEVTIWDGDYYGFPVTKRSIYTMELKEKHDESFNLIEKIVLNEVKELAKQEVKKDEERRIQRLIDDKLETILDKYLQE